MKLLQAQLEPRFLLNLLTEIRDLLDTDVKKAKAMQLALIKYLRISLEKLRLNEILIEHEAEIVKNYLDIFKAKLGNTLNYSIDVQDPIKNFMVPPIIVQPIIELILKFLENTQNPIIQIHFNIQKYNQGIQLEIREQGIAITGTDQHENINSLKERLGIIYDQKSQVTLVEDKPLEFKALIYIPHKGKRNFPNGKYDTSHHGPHR